MQIETIKIEERNVRKIDSSLRLDDKHTKYKFPLHIQNIQNNISQNDKMSIEI